MSQGELEAVYCFRWNRRKGRPGAPMTVEQARRNYHSGEEFTAALVPRGVGRYPVLVTCAWKNSYASTTFLDGLGRNGTKYIFQKAKEGFLFLSEIYVWNYTSEKPHLGVSQASQYEHIKIGQGGHVVSMIVDRDENTKETSEYFDVPVSGSWEPVPDFGDWGSISRYER